MYLKEGLLWNRLFTSALWTLKLEFLLKYVLKCCVESVSNPTSHNHPLHRTLTFQASRPPECSSQIGSVAWFTFLSKNTYAKPTTKIPGQVSFPHLHQQDECAGKADFFSYLTRTRVFPGFFHKKRALKVPFLGEMWAWDCCLLGQKGIAICESVESFGAPVGKA